MLFAVCAKLSVRNRMTLQNEPNWPDSDAFITNAEHIQFIELLFLTLM